MRVDKTNYYLDIAEAALERSTCLRRKYGAVVVKNDEIISTGYNGAPRGRENCTDIGTCIREKLKMTSAKNTSLEFVIINKKLVRRLQIILKLIQ